MIVILIAFCVLLMISPLFRVILKNLHLIGIYSFVDLVNYIKYQRWREFDLYGIDIFIFNRYVRSWKNTVYDS